MANLGWFAVALGLVASAMAVTQIVMGWRIAWLTLGLGVFAVVVGAIGANG